MAQVKGDDGTSSGITPNNSYGVWGDSDGGNGVTGTSRQANGLNGQSLNGIGVNGHSDNHDGVRGVSNLGYGVRGEGGDIGAYAHNTTVNGNDVYLATRGLAGDFHGPVYVDSGQYYVGVTAKGRSAGVSAYGVSTGVYTEGGLLGVSAKGSIFGVWGIGEGTGVAGYGTKDDSYGVYGKATNVAGVYGHSDNNDGVLGISNLGYGVRGEGGNIGAYAHNTTVNGNDVYLATRGLAGDFYGDVYIHGRLTKTGGGTFRIDHPLDPANKYLSHSFVESPDMKNIYDGVVVLNAKGEAVVKLPAWFEALNKYFRYQLTPMGAQGPNLYIAEEITKNRFKIAGGKPKMKVSWQVTGIRKDAWANAHRIRVEEKKPAKERGYYLHPELHGKPGKKGIQQARYPEQIEQRKLLKEHKQQIQEHEKRMQKLLEEHEKQTKEFPEKAPVR